MEIKTKALCLKAEDYKDNDKILTLATLDMGKITVKIRSVKSPKSKLKLCASPLCFGEYILTKTNNTYIVIGCSIEESFFDCWKDINKYTSSQIILELLNKATYAENNCQRETFFALQALSVINYAPMYPYIVAVWYIGKLLGGLSVDIDDEENLPKDVLMLIKSITELPPDELGSLEISGAMLLKMLTYSNLMIKNTLNANINSINEALKILNQS